MWKLANALPVVVLLAGCKDTAIVGDNSPTNTSVKVQ